MALSYNDWDQQTIWSTFNTRLGMCTLIICYHEIQGVYNHSSERVKQQLQKRNKYSHQGPVKKSVIVEEILTLRMSSNRKVRNRNCRQPRTVLVQNNHWQIMNQLLPKTSLRKNMYEDIPHARIDNPQSDIEKFRREECGKVISRRAYMVIIGVT